MCPSLLPCDYLLFVFHQEIDVVQATHQAVFLVGIDFKMFTLTRRQIGDGLVGQVHFDLRLMVVFNALEQLLKERFGHDDGQNEIVQFVVLVYVGEERADNHPETGTGNGPCSMLAGRARAEVLSRNQYDARIGGVVHHETLVRLSIRVIPPIPKQVVSHPLLVGCLQEAGRYNLVGVDVLER